MLLRHWYDKAKNLIVTLRFSILTIFIILFMVAMGLMISIFYINFSRSMTYVSRKLIDEVSTSIFQDITAEFQKIQIETTAAALLIRRQIIDTQNDAQISEFVNHTMGRERYILPSIQSVFWANEAGSMYLAEKNDNGSITTENVTQTKTGATRTIIKRDLQGNVTSTQIKTAQYDPRNRFWYTDAKKSGKPIITDIFHFIYFDKLYWGLTIAAPVTLPNGQFIGIFGSDIRLDFLRKLLEQIHISDNSLIFIVLDNGKLISYPHLIQYQFSTLQDIANIKNPAVPVSFNLYQKSKQTEFIFKVNQQTYLAAYKEISNFGPHHWLLGIVVPENDFIGVLKKTNRITVGIGFLILIVGIILFSKLITRAVRSLKYLIKETHKIKNFELGEDIHIESRIKEIIYLADALNNMKKGLRSFQKYVPADLVRQLIEKNMDAQIGGTKTQLVVLFSDIKNFTTVAERLDPNQLMTYCCDYFDELSKIIIQHHGTIDKYIGDSIMAFWGAPNPERDPCYLAAKAVLACQKRLETMNAQWEARGLPPLITRFGMHRGEAIVGNLGSSERINYTAIGDAINITSRLEGANKIYHTTIIVSESVYQAIQDRFILRLLDRVALKGKTHDTYIYELMADKETPLTFDIDMYQQLFLSGFTAYQQQKWNEAIRYFEQCLTVYPEDYVAKLFIERCKTFKNTPPSAEWNGIWYF